MDINETQAAELLAGVQLYCPPGYSNAYEKMALSQLATRISAALAAARLDGAQPDEAQRAIMAMLGVERHSEIVPALRSLLESYESCLEKCR